MSVHSDDAAYNEAYIGENYYKVVHDLDLSLNDLEALARNSFLSAFMPESESQEFLSDLQDFMSKFRSHAYPVSQLLL